MAEFGINIVQSLHSHISSSGRYSIYNPGCSWYGGDFHYICLKTVRCTTYAAGIAYHQPICPDGSGCSLTLVSGGIQIPTVHIDRQTSISYIYALSKGQILSFVRCNGQFRNLSVQHVFHIIADIEAGNSHISVCRLDFAKYQMIILPVVDHNSRQIAPQPWL
jgi:hypothetical protein